MLPRSPRSQSAPPCSQLVVQLQCGNGVPPYLSTLASTVPCLANEFQSMPLPLHVQHSHELSPVWSPCTWSTGIVLYLVFSCQVTVILRQPFYLCFRFNICHLAGVISVIDPCFSFEFSSVCFSLSCSVQSLLCLHAFAAAYLFSHLTCPVADRVARLPAEPRCPIQHQYCLSFRCSILTTSVCVYLPSLQHYIGLLSRPVVLSKLRVAWRSSLDIDPRVGKLVSPLLLPGSMQYLIRPTMPGEHAVFQSKFIKSEACIFYVHQISTLLLTKTVPNDVWIS